MPAAKKPKIEMHQTYRAGKPGTWRGRKKIVFLPGQKIHKNVVASDRRLKKSEIGKGKLIAIVERQGKKTYYYTDRRNPEKKARIVQNTSLFSELQNLSQISDNTKLYLGAEKISPKKMNRTQELKTYEMHKRLLVSTERILGKKKDLVGRIVQPNIRTGVTHYYYIDRRPAK